MIASEFPDNGPARYRRYRVDAGKFCAGAVDDPGLAFFYGGMVRARSVLNMLMMSISAMGVVTVLWVLYGYSTAFGNDKDDLFGDPTEYFGLKGLIGGNSAAAAAGKAATEIPLAGTLPMNVFVAFQLMFAIITVALDLGRGRRTV